MILPFWWPVPITTPAPTPTPTPVATWTNPTDWEPQPGDHVKVHIPSDDHWRYSSIDVAEGDLGRLGHRDKYHDGENWIVLFDTPRGKYTGLLFRIDQLEFVE